MQEILQTNCKLNTHRPIIVGVSGGVDSLVLLELLKERYPVVIAHFNHLIRQEANDDARFVKALAMELNKPYVQGEGSTKKYAIENHMSVEEAGRELRYRFLFEEAICFDAQAVVVAHNADDQVETVLMHLLRGAGLDGLTGMKYRWLPNPWSDRIALVRPLLDFWRWEIELYCEKHNLKPIRDVSNEDISFTRNRVRHELLPLLDSYVPGVRSRLWQTMKLLTVDRQVLDDLTDSLWKTVFKEDNSKYLSFDRQKFNALSKGLQQRLVRKAISHLQREVGVRDVSYDVVSRVLEFSLHPTSTKQMDLGLGLRIYIEDDNLFISNWQTELPKTNWPQLPGDPSDPQNYISLHVPGEVALSSNWKLIAEKLPDVESALEDAINNIDRFQAWIDLGDDEPCLIIRSRRNGDRFRPLGMAGKSMKISDIMINQKIPQRLRASWPLICIEEEIVWVPGYRSGHDRKIRSTTRKVVKLRLKSE